MFDIVIPARAGIQCLFHKRRWVPAFAGTTKLMEPSMKFARCFTAFGMAMLWPLLAVEQAAGQAAGQSYPSKPVHVIVPFTAGSATDILARTFGQKLPSCGVSRSLSTIDPVLAGPSARPLSRSRLPTAIR